MAARYDCTSTAKPVAHLQPAAWPHAPAHALLHRAPPPHQVALAGGVSFYGIDTLNDDQRGLKQYNATKVTIMTRNRSSTPGKYKHKQKKLMLNLLLSNHIINLLPNCSSRHGPMHCQQHAPETELMAVTTSDKNLSTNRRISLLHPDLDLPSTP